MRSFVVFVDKYVSLRIYWLTRNTLFIKKNTISTFAMTFTNTKWFPLKLMNILEYKSHMDCLHKTIKKRRDNKLIRLYYAKKIVFAFIDNILVIKLAITWPQAWFLLEIALKKKLFDPTFTMKWDMLK